MSRNSGGNTWEVVIGLETHAQLQTKSKIFSGASIAFGAEPNVQACAVDIALPGVLPVLNREAVVCAIKFGLAVGATIAPRSIFARKNYFYPDLPKGYQISQFEIPVVAGGSLAIKVSQGDTALEKTVRLTRAHLEEDAGKSIHGGIITESGDSLTDEDGNRLILESDEDENRHILELGDRTGIDLNRAGTPLLEIVTEPDMSSSAEAVAYARALHSLVRWIGICDGNMQEGSFRCDANVSVRRPGEPLGTRREIKNLNSFRFMQQAIDYEIQWQINEIEEGRAIQQATVLFDPDTGETRSMRSKEDAHDYRYFPDPDLLPLAISPAWVAEVKAGLPELPQSLRARFVAEYALTDYDAGILTAEREMADFFLRAVAITGTGNAKLVANWLQGEVAARLNREELGISAAPITAEQLAGLIVRIADNTISNSIARKVFEALWQREGTTADEIIEKQGLRQITDSSAIEGLIDEVLAANQKSVDEYRAGKEKAFNALVGQVMKATKGKANPQQVNDMLLARLQK